MGPERVPCCEVEATRSIALVPLTIPTFPFDIIIRHFLLGTTASDCLTGSSDSAPPRPSIAHRCSSSDYMDAHAVSYVP